VDAGDSHVLALTVLDRGIIFALNAVNRECAASGGRVINGRVGGLDINNGGGTIIVGKGCQLSGEANDFLFGSLGSLYSG